MLIIYIIVSLLLYVTSISIFKKKINPTSLYVMIWLFCILIHQSGIIYFYNLRINTWWYIIGFMICYSLGNFMGCMLFDISKGDSTDKRRQYHFQKREDQEKGLYNSIIIMSIITSIGVVKRVSLVISSYGIYFYKYVSDLYTQNIYKKDIEAGLEVFLYIDVILTGIYIVKYGFKKILVFPMVLAIVYQLCCGSRGNLIICICFFSAPIVFQKTEKKKRKINGSLLLAIVTVIYISLKRIQDKVVNESVIGALFKRILFYFSSPVAVLNEYIVKGKESKIWGEKTFDFIRKVLYKVNIIQAYNETESIGTYYTPTDSNVFTYIGTLIYDFKLIGAVMVTFLAGILFAYSFKKVENNSSLVWNVIYAVCFGVVMLSFFEWFVSSAIIWITLCVGIPLGLIIEYRLFKKKCI